MKVTVEIEDSQIIACLRAAIVNSISVSHPNKFPAPEHQMTNLIDSLEFCAAANRVIKYFGGSEVELEKIEPYITRDPDWSTGHVVNPKVAQRKRTNRPKAG